MRLPAALRSIPRRRLYAALIGASLALTLANLYFFRHDFAALYERAFSRQEVEVARWQSWARYYDNLFSMLPWGERVGIQMHGQKSAGIVLEHTGEGMVARHALFLEREHPGVVLSMSPATAEELLAGVPDVTPDAIWQKLKDLLYDRRIDVWSDPDLERLEAGGYLALLRAIDTRPRGMDWPTIRTRLGELPREPESPMARLPEGRAGEVVRRAIEHAGGWEAWEAKRGLAYRKRFRRFDAAGKVERETVQLHRYRLHPSPAMRIEYEEDGREILLVNDGQQAAKLLDGEPATAQADRDQAWNSTFGSHYVLAMPFKLTDPGAELADAGQEVLPDGTLVDKVRVTYEEGAGSAGGMHTWTYYFAADDGRLVANFLQYGTGPDDYSYTEYAELARVDGILLAVRREGFATNGRAEKGARISEYRHEELRFEPDLPDDLFTVPATRSPSP